MNKSNEKFKLSTQDLCAIAMVFLTFAIVYLTNVLADISSQQAKDNKEQIVELQKSRQADYELRFDEKIFSGKNLEIVAAVQRNKPILKANGGRFEDYELDLYLGDLDQLNSIFKMKLISEELVYNNFCDDIEDTNNDKEVQDYLTKIRKINSTYFEGFSDIADFCVKYDKS